MEFIGLLTKNAGALAFAVLALGGVLAFVYAGWQYQTAFGDQQQMARARNALFGGVIGIVIGGFAFIIPEVLSREVVEPSGGEAVVASVSSECDEIFRNRLALETHVNSPARMNQLVRIIQGDVSGGCGTDLWDPVVGFDAGGSGTSAYADYRAHCFNNELRSTVTIGGLDGSSGVDGVYEVGGVAVPGNLSYDVSSVVAGVPRPVSSRDRDNNILVYFGQLLDSNDRPIDPPMSNAAHRVSGTDGYPTDGAACWMFIARENLWLAN